MQQGIAVGFGVEVASRTQGDHDVGREDHGSRTSLGRDLLWTKGSEQQGRQHHGDRDDHGQSGREASEASGKEPAEPDAAVGRVLPLQQARDDEAGDDEKDVDPDETARQRSAGVEEHDGDNGEGPQALDVAAAMAGQRHSRSFRGSAAAASSKAGSSNGAAP